MIFSVHEDGRETRVLDLTVRDFCYLGYEQRPLFRHHLVSDGNYGDAAMPIQTGEQPTLREIRGRSSA